MHLIIISCSPRTIKASNTDKILKQFKSGFEQEGNTSQVYYLVKRRRWEEIRQAFYNNEQIIFAIPLYVECIPGLMMEFLETLEPYKDKLKKTKVGFILQGGFPEASQLRCCEEYLKKLPGYLNCEYNGTLIKGDMFGVSLVPEKKRNKAIGVFYDAGCNFAKEGTLDNEYIRKLAGAEYFSNKVLFLFRILAPFQRRMLKHIAKSAFGCNKSLRLKPYEQYILKKE